MNIFGANITQKISDYLNTKLENDTTFENINQTLYNDFGIINFFNCDEELGLLKNKESIFVESDRTEYGDFQTNQDLANKTVQHLIDKNINPEIIVEPTCGKGNFIIASLKNFRNLKYICGVEIYAPYVWQTKFNIIDFYLNDQTEKDKCQLPTISINHCDVFEFDFKAIAKKYAQDEILIIGNPPWVTNSKLSSLNSDNLPRKTNFKNHSGLDAMTGKGNFDIAEFITMTMVSIFQNMKGNLLLLKIISLKML
jgi:hypothetical protein